MLSTISHALMLRAAYMILLIRDSSLDYVCSGGGCGREQALGRNFTGVHQVIGAICWNPRQAKTCLIGTAVTFSSRLGTKVARTRGIYVMHCNVLIVTVIDGLPANYQVGKGSEEVNVCCSPQNRPRSLPHLLITSY